QRHLAAFEALAAPAGARGLTLTAAPAGLAFPRADAAPDPLAGLPRAVVGKLVEFHWPVPCCSAASALVNDAHEVVDLVDHAAHRRTVLQRGTAMQLVQPQPDQGLALVETPADRAADLLDDDGLVGHVPSLPQA